MICVSLAEETPVKCIRALKGIDFAEIRIDKMTCSIEDIKKIFSQHSCLIATCRPGAMDDKTRKALLTAAIAAGAAFVDIEVDANDKFKKAIIKKARGSGCRVVISYHNLDETPQTAELELIKKRCFESGADIVKIACRVNSDKENARLFSLYDQRHFPLIVIGMGNRGKITRIVAPFLGSPFTYACLKNGTETAAGQMNMSTLERIFQELKNV